MKPLKFILYSNVILQIFATECIENSKTNTGVILSTPNYNNLGKVNGTCNYHLQSRTNYVEIQIIDRTYLLCPKFNWCKCSKLTISSEFEKDTFCENNLTRKPIKFVGLNYHLDFVSEKASLKFMLTTSTMCRADQYECLDKSNCYSRESICNDVYDCRDGSDEIFCGRKVCKNNYLEETYFLCGSGECINRFFVNNGIRDCRDGSDEANHVSYILLGTLILFILFSMIIFRWFVFRRDINRLMQNMPEFPLPPFRAPGEHSEYEVEISDADIQSGGEIFEAFVESRRNNESCHRNRIKHVKTKERRRLVDTGDGDDSILALASLSIDVASCIGLSKENLAKMNSASSTNSSKKFNSSRGDADDKTEVEEGLTEVKVSAKSLRQN